MHAIKLSLTLLALVCSLTEATLLTHDAADHAAEVGVSTDFQNEDSSSVGANNPILVEKHIGYEQFSQAMKNDDHEVKTNPFNSNDDEKSETNGTAENMTFDELSLSTTIMHIILCKFLIQFIDSSIYGFVAAAVILPTLSCIIVSRYEIPSWLAPLKPPNAFMTVVYAEIIVIFLKFCGMLARLLGRQTWWTDRHNFIRRIWTQTALWIKSCFTKRFPIKSEDHLLTR